MEISPNPTSPVWRIVSTTPPNKHTPPNRCTIRYRNPDPIAAFPPPSPTKNTDADINSQNKNKETRPPANTTPNAPPIYTHAATCCFQSCTCRAYTIPITDMIVNTYPNTNDSRSTRPSTSS